MSNATVVGFSGNFTRPSKTRAFVDSIVTDIARRNGLSGNTFDIEDVGPSLGGARWVRDLDGQAKEVLRRVIEADALVVGSPTYKGSYTGLFKPACGLASRRRSCSSSRSASSSRLRQDAARHPACRPAARRDGQDLRTERDLFRIILPGALPSIFVGLRYALGIMWLTLIVAETIAANPVSVTWPCRRASFC